MFQLSVKLMVCGAGVRHFSQKCKTWEPILPCDVDRTAPVV